MAPGAAGRRSWLVVFVLVFPPPQIPRGQTYVLRIIGLPKGPVHSNELDNKVVKWLLD